MGVCHSELPLTEQSVSLTSWIWSTSTSSIERCCQRLLPPPTHYWLIERIEKTFMTNETITSTNPKIKKSHHSNFILQLNVYSKASPVYKLRHVFKINKKDVGGSTFHDHLTCLVFAITGLQPGHSFCCDVFNCSKQPALIHSFPYCFILSRGLQWGWSQSQLSLGTPVTGCQSIVGSKQPVFIFSINSYHLESAERMPQFSCATLCNFSLLKEENFKSHPYQEWQQ